MPPRKTKKKTAIINLGAISNDEGFNPAPLEIICDMAGNLKFFAGLMKKTGQGRIVPGKQSWIWDVLQPLSLPMLRMLESKLETEKEIRNRFVIKSSGPVDSEAEFSVSVIEEGTRAGLLLFKEIVPENTDTTEDFWPPSALYFASLGSKIFSRVVTIGRLPKLFANSIEVDTDEPNYEIAEFSNGNFKYWEPSWNLGRGTMIVVAAGAPTDLSSDSVLQRVERIIKKQWDLTPAGQTRNRYLNLFDSVSDGLLLGSGNRIFEINQAAAKMLNLGEEVDTILTFGDVFPEIQYAFDPEPKSGSYSFERIVNNQVEWFEVIINPQFMDLGNQRLIQVRNITEQKNQGVEIVEQPQILNTLSEYVPALIRMTDNDGNSIYNNKAWFQFLGKNYNSESPIELESYIHPEDLKGVKLSLTTNLSKRKPFELFYRIQRADGQFRHILEHFVPLKHLPEKFRGFISSGQDVTERRESEISEKERETLLRVESKLRLAFDASSLPTLTLHASGLIQYVNQIFIEITGLDKSDIEGHYWPNIFTDEIGNPASVAQLLEPKDKTAKPRFKLLKPNGEAVYLQVRILFPNNNQDNQLLTVVTEDITEELKTIKKLEDTNTQLEDFLENATDLIQISTPSGRFIYVNRAWKQKMGYEDNEVNLLRLEDILHPDYRQATRLYLHSLIEEKKEKVEFETVFISKVGRPLRLSASVNCRFHENKPESFRGVFIDITDRFRASNAQKLYYSIASQSIKSSNLKTLYENIHQELRKNLDVNNFYIALLEDEGTEINFAYYHDESLKREQYSARRRLDINLTKYAISANKPVFLYEEEIVELSVKNRMLLMGPLPRVWMAAPLKINNRITGVIALQSFTSRDAYDETDLELLDFISGQVAFAIQRKRHEQQLHEQSARLQAIFESSSHLIWSVNRQKSLTTFNKNYFDKVITGRSLRSLVEANTLDQNTFNFSDPLMEHILQEGYEKAFKGVPQNFELMVKAGENNVWYDVYLNPIFMPDGEIEEVSGIAHDITQKKQDKTALEESEQKFRRIFESFQDLYFRTDINGRIQLISPSVLDLTGYKPADLYGQKITNHFSLNIRVLRNLVLLRRNGTLRNFEISVVNNQGKSIDFLANLRLIYDALNITVGVEGVARDITDIKRASEEVIKAKEFAEHSLKIKEGFLANMSHEIRTPMNGIIGVIDLLATTKLNKQQLDYVDTIRKSSENLLHILNDILDISKIEAGKMTLYPAALEINQVFDKLMSLFGHLAKAQDLTLNYSIDDDVPRYIYADETRLIQILSNLTSNAIKFTTKGAVQIRVSVQLAKEEQFVIRVAVKDTGIGISKKDLGLLFGHFDQLDNSTTKVHSGAGLGLAIAKRLCTLMGGDIGVISKPGQGSTFWFTFTTVKTEKPGQASKELDQGKWFKFPEERKPFLLVVDDNKINLKVASEILEKANCIVDNAADGIEAIEKVKNNRYHLVLMDIQMPRMDGVTATRNIRELGLTNLPPIIAMTAYSMREDREKFLSSGLDDYLPKPIKAKALIDTVKKWLLPPDLNPATVVEENKLANAPIIDTEVTAQLEAHLGHDGVIEILSDFIPDAEALIVAALSELESKNYEELRSLMHTLKGNAGTLGVTQVFLLAQKIEKELKQGIFLNTEQDLNEIFEKFRKFAEYFRYSFSK